MGKYNSIGIVCEGGIGSSAMGAALLRKVLNENGMGYISVKAYGRELTGLDTELLICGKNYYRHVKDQLEGMEVLLVENLLHKEEYQALVLQLAGHGKI